MRINKRTTRNSDLLLYHILVLIIYWVQDNLVRAIANRAIVYVPGYMFNLYFRHRDILRWMLAECFNYLGMSKIILVQPVGYAVKFTANLG
jgi:hypothetical protein